jgi:hypothetical protein
MGRGEVASEWAVKTVDVEVVPEGRSWSVVLEPVKELVDIKSDLTGCRRLILSVIFLMPTGSVLRTEKLIMDILIVWHGTHLCSHTVLHPER